MIEEGKAANVLLQCDEVLPPMEAPTFIDSGASAHYLHTSVELSDARDTNRRIRGAGEETLVGDTVGNRGALRGAVSVPGLQQSLVSVGALVDSHKVAVLFTRRGVFLLHDSIAERQARNCPRIGRRAPCGLYETKVDRVTAGVNALAEDDAAFRRSNKHPRVGTAAALISDSWYGGDIAPPVRSELHQ